MSSPTTIAAPAEAQRAELQAVLNSELFARAPTLAHLLSYLCEKTFAGETSHIKEYSIAVDVFGRRESFDQDADSIVRVQANRLRKRLAQYYETEGRDHGIHIFIPVGQYVPVFKENPGAAVPSAPERHVSSPKYPWIVAILVILAAIAIVAVWRTRRPASVEISTPGTQTAPGQAVGLPVGDEIRLLAGSTRTYTDRAGKVWLADRYFTGGTPVRSSVQHVWRTQDPELYRNSRQGEFSYAIPLKPGIYELRLHFAETFYGPEEPGGGGEGSRVMAIALNGKQLLGNFDVAVDADGSRAADVKVFTDISPAPDGSLHLDFSSVHGGRALLCAIEILPGLRGSVRPIRILTRDTSYYSNDSHWWSPDVYFKGGQLATRVDSVSEADDPELYESERWGRFSYAIPVPPGRYKLTLHFVERRFGAANRDNYVGPPQTEGARVFNVFCNGKLVLRDLDILKEVGENRPLARTITGLEPNAQGKLLLDFVPTKDYATVTAVEVLPD